jgi:hypothetical protein
VAAIPTSGQLIAAALASGSITYEESLLDRALALYNSPGLPQQFHSKVFDMEAAGALLREVDLKESTLSAGLLKQLAPYRARPADPISIYNSPSCVSYKCQHAWASFEWNLTRVGNTPGGWGSPVATNTRVHLDRVRLALACLHGSY